MWSAFSDANPIDGETQAENEISYKRSMNEEAVLPNFTMGKRKRKKKQRHPDEVSDWDSCEEDSGARRSPTNKRPPTAKKTEEESSTQFSECESSASSDGEWLTLPKKLTKLNRALPGNGSKEKYVHEKKLFACEMCDYKNWMSSAVSKHMSRNHQSRLTCKTCNFKARGLKLLECHTKTHTGQSSQPINEEHESIIEEDVRIKLEPTDDLSNSDHEEGNDEETNNLPTKSEKNVRILYECDYCSYSSRQKCHVNRHMRELHFRDKRKGEGAFACDECGYRTTRKNLMESHAMRHTGEKPYCCEICNYRCILKVNLKRHQLNHTGETPFACKICEYRCKQSFDLRKHMWTHSGEKPYACDLCDYRGTQSSSVITHKKSHHGKGRNSGKPYACDLCDFTSKRMKALHSHRTTTHAIITSSENFTSPVTHNQSVHDPVIGDFVKIEPEDMKQEEEFEKEEIKCEEQEECECIKCEEQEDSECVKCEEQEDSEAVKCEEKED